MYLSGLTNQPKSNMFDSDEDDETASQQYLKQVGFLYFFLQMCESLVEKQSVKHKRLRSFIPHVVIGYFWDLFTIFKWVSDWLEHFHIRYVGRIYCGPPF